MSGAMGAEDSAGVKAPSNSVVIAAAAMAEAIRRHRSIRGLDVVGKDGRSRYSVDALSADYDLDMAERAYREAVGEPYEHWQIAPKRMKPEELLERHQRTANQE